MRRTVLRGVLRRLLAGGAVAGLLIGGPILLRSLGSPLPGRLPTWSGFVTDLRIGFVPAGVAGKMAIGAAWALWVFLVYEVLAETWSRIHRHAGRRASVLGPFQPLVSKVVASLLLSAPVAARSLPAGALPVPVPVAVHVADPVAAVPSREPLQPPVAASTADPVQDLPTYVVQPRDTLWGIARRCLGDPLRWSEIAALNAGRAETNGHFGDPHWIQPGWILLLPSDATLPTPAPTAPAGSVTPPMPVTPPAPVVLPARVTPPGLASITSPAPPSQWQTVAVPLGAHGGVKVAGARHRPSSHGPRVPVTPIGYGLLAAGVIGMLDRMRRAQQRRRPQGLTIRLPDGELSNVERGLRVAADIELGSFVDSAMRLLANLVADGVCAPPAVAAVRCRQDAVELVLDESAGETAPVAPGPFRATGPVWSLDRQWLSGLSPQERRRLSGAEAPLPTLVTLGCDPEGTVLVDVERMGSLSVTGEDATLVLQGMVVELATLPWADGAEVVVVGHPGELRALDRVRRAPSIAGLLSEMQQRAAHQGALAALAGTAGTIEGRWRQGGDSWDPVVVVCLPAAADAEPEAAGRLVALAGEGDRGVAVLAGADLATRWWASAEGGMITLVGPRERVPGEQPSTDPGQELAVQPMHAELLDDVDALVAVAAAPAVKPAASSRAPGMSAGEREDSGRSVHEVEVRVLGPVDVEGAAKPFSRAWCLDLVVYLALHPGGATTDQWATALWPDRIMAAASLHSTASAARRALGVSASGLDHLPRAHGRLALGPSVTTDWARLRSLAATDDPAQWAAALRLVRGRPLESLRGGDWAVLEGIVAGIEAGVVDLASRYAEWCLVNDDPAGAESAARRGLRVSPYDERLYRLLLRSADAAGNPAGVERTMEELAELVARDVEPYDVVHPETWDLYVSLSRRPRVGQGRGAANQDPSSLARAR